MSIDVIVAGHTCLDVLPELPKPFDMRPGSLAEAGPVCFAPGGAVSNVGLALAALDVRVNLIGSVGGDVAGDVLLAFLRSRVPADALAFRRLPEDSTSYTVILSPPGVDRVFLHHSGCNDRFDPAVVDLDRAGGARLLYFGYPPAMRSIYADGGTGLADLFRRARAQGLTTALDMSMPDPASEAGRQDWPAFLRRVLPQVDIFLPSWEETLYMLDRERFTAGAEPTGGFLRGISERLLALGTRIVGLKLGSRGMYVRTAPAGRLEDGGCGVKFHRDHWASRELWAPIFSVEVVGTTGSGDATVAGFLAAALRGLRPEAALRSAVGVGAACVEAADATSGLRSWDQTHARIRSGWRQDERTAPPGSWRPAGEPGVFGGPRDRADPQPGTETQ